MAMYDLIADLFNQAYNMHASPTTTVLVDFNATATPTNPLGPGQVQGPTCFTTGTLVYTPGGKQIVGHHMPGTFSLYQNSAAVTLTITAQTSPTGGPAIQFGGLALVPTTPARAHPTSVNVDGATNAIYGVISVIYIIVNSALQGLPGSSFVTITLFNLRTQ
jgi:hypothetical protein